MPTWRDWLMESESEFYNSLFYIMYSELFCNQKLQNCLREMNLKLLVSLHVEFEKYKHLFEQYQNDTVIISDMHERSITERIRECSMVLTDYSSVVFDVLYLNKPAVFFQFDQEQYNNVRGSYIDLTKDLPGPVTYSVDETVDEIVRLMKNDFSFTPELQEKANRYFDYHDKNNAERVYDAIIQCREEISDEY